MGLGFVLGVGWGTVRAGDLLRGGAPVATAAAPLSSGGSTSLGGSAVNTPSQDRLARTTQALEAVKQMQTAARNLAIAGPNNLKAGLTTVPVNSFQQANGLVPSVNGLWTGAKQPVLKTNPTTTTTTTNVTVQQTDQQALLTWDSFNVGKSTTLTFDQSAGGSNAGQWIAFNYVRDPTGAPSQILGAIKTIGMPGAGGVEQVGGQVYVLNANGIIFGGSSQVNVHALVASSLPINYNLIQRGILNNPDAQFLFSALPLSGGSKGPTGTFDPAVASPDGLAPEQTPLTTDGHYGDVVVQAGAQLTAVTNADHIGGRVALIGPNVSNAGTISTADGQTILAAGLQVGVAAHRSEDPTLRGLDVFVGAIADPADLKPVVTGTVTNARTTNADGTVYTGLITAPRGAITLTGKTVNQLGAIESSTSVAYNGRVDLVAGYNAEPNSNFDPSIATGATPARLAFIYQSNVGDTADGAEVVNSGAVTLGKDSMLRILPEQESLERTVGDLTLPSQVNIQGQSVLVSAGATLLAPGAQVPLSPAYRGDGQAFDAGVAIQAGSWYNRGLSHSQFIQSADSQQIYIDKGAAIDVAGLAGVSAAVTENIFSVELRGSELAGSPLQRDGPLRGQTIQVDLRQHGPWDQTLNGGLGGYTWVGTPLADTAGWLGLTTHSVAELTTNGGTVSLKAGGAVVLQTGSAIDVSGGSIAYQGGVTQTTRLIAGGRAYDIAKASPDLVYDGVYTSSHTTVDPKWGVSESTVNALMSGVTEQGYSQGGIGGSLAITSAVLALDGSLLGATTAGAQQRALAPNYSPSITPDPASPKSAGVPGWLLATDSRPVPAQLAITVRRQYVAPDDNVRNYSPTPASVVFRPTSSLGAAENFLDSGAYTFPLRRKYELDLSPALVDPAGAGFGILKVDNSDNDLGAAAASGLGNITILAGTTLVLPVAGSLSLAAGNIKVESNPANGRTGIVAPAGSVTLSAFDLAPSEADTVAFLANSGKISPEDVPVYNPLRGAITLGAGAQLSVAGPVVDDRPRAANSAVAPLVTAGGSVTLSGSAITLASGSLVDVSGGGTVGSSGKIAYADAGRISLSTGKTGFGNVLGGSLRLAGASLQGYAGLGKAGGTLSLQAPAVTVQALTGGEMAVTDATGKLTLAAAFFSAGGFASFNLTGLGVALDATGNYAAAAPAVTVAPNTSVRPQVQSWETIPRGNVVTLDVGLRAPARLSFKTVGELKSVTGDIIDTNSTVLFGAGSEIVTDPLGTVALAAGLDGSIDLQGRIVAPGGKVSLIQNLGTTFLPSIHLGPASLIDAAGTTTYKTDLAGYHKSGVADGGSIIIDGNVVAEKGAKLDVSGASDSVLLPPGDPVSGALQPGVVVTPAVVNSNGGIITLYGEQVLFTQATLAGHAGSSTIGGTTAHGGELVVGSNRSLAQETITVQPTDPVLIVAATSPDFVYQGLGKQVHDAAGNSFADANNFGLIRFGADTYAQGGFGTLSLTVSSNALNQALGLQAAGTGTGALQIQGNVSLAAERQINLADGGVLSLVPAGNAPVPAPATLTLNAPYIVLGRPFLGPLQSTEQASPFGSVAVAPTYGQGTVTATAASLIDVGNLVLQGTGTTTLDATKGGTTNGAIRGDGTLDASGDIVLRAGQIYPPTAVTFNVIAHDYVRDGVTTASTVTIKPAGSVPAAALPLSAGGTLAISASVIDQGGQLLAPQGIIRLGADGDQDPFTGAALAGATTLTLQPGSVTSVSASDPVTGKPVTIPYGINVNGDTWIDPTGTDITNLGPTAKAITLNSASINFLAATKDKPAASIDLAGGGDLYAYQFVPGTGGKLDVLLGKTASAFAIIPGSQSAYAPYAPFDTGTDAQLSLGADPGYVIGNSALTYSVGDKIHLLAAGTLPEGDYTLLPARYALLPGAYLVTPQSGATTLGAARSLTRPNGAVLAAGYRYNGFDGAGSVQQTYRTFEVAPQSVVRKRAEYTDYSADTFFPAVATAREVPAPRGPLDAGQLAFVAGSKLQLEGSVALAAATNGRGGLVDINSTADILIGSSAVITAHADDTDLLLLDAAKLGGLGADSLVVGGRRSPATEGTAITVSTDHITIDNAGEPLTGADVVLVANKGLTLADKAEITQTRTLTAPADALVVQDTIRLDPTPGNTVLTVARGGAPITFPSGLPAGSSLLPGVDGTITNADGTSATFSANTPITTLAAGSTITLKAGGTLTAGFDLVANPAPVPIPVTWGDGVLLRVSSDPKASISRSTVATSTTPQLTVGAGVKVSGGGIILDSTAGNAMDPTSQLSGKALTLDSGSINVVLDQPGIVAATGGLQLSGTSLPGLLTGAQSLALTSYGALDLYGSGTIGPVDAAGQPLLASLGLHAGEIRGFSAAGGGGNVTFAAKAILLDNAAVAPVTGATLPKAGSLGFNAGGGTITLGANSLSVDQYAAVALQAGGGVQLKGAGTFAVENNLTVSSALVTGATGSNYTVSAGGDLRLETMASAPTVASDGLGAQLSLTGATVTADSKIVLHSGRLGLRATTGDVLVGSSAAALLDVSGTSQSFYDVTRYTDAGQVNLTADLGSVKLSQSATVDVSANRGGGRAGDLTISAVAGAFVLADTAHLQSQGGADGRGGPDGSQGGAFALDVGSLAHTATLDLALNPDTAAAAGGFVRARSLRVRTGDVLVDGMVLAHAYSLSADQGNITVTADGKIDAGGTATDATGGRVDVAGKLTAGTWVPDGAGNLRDSAGKIVTLQGGTGGSIALAAAKSVTLQSGSSLSAAATYFDAAGKGGSVTLEAGSATNGVAPSSSQSRDPFTGTFSGAAVVDIRSGALIDLSVASVDAIADPNTRATAIATAAGLGHFRGTLHLRAPQTTPAGALPPDVQINPIDGEIRNASSIVVEGYRTYSPVAGYIDSVEADIDADGRRFASATNTGTVLNSLTRNWSTGGVNAALDPTAGVLLHLQPGAEIIGASAAPSVSTVSYAAPGTTSSIALPAGGILTLPNTTGTGAVSTNDYLLASASTLKAVDAGSYKNSVTSIGPATSATVLTVLANTSLKVGTSAVAAGKLSSTVGGTITPVTGPAVQFAAGILPALPASSTVTFAGSGTVASATTGNATGLGTLTVQNTFLAGVEKKLPANSTVTLSTKGGTVTFTTAGTLTWSARLAVTNTFTAQLPANGTSFTTGTGGATVVAGSGAGSGLTLIKTTAATSSTGGSVVTLSAGGTLVLPTGTFSTDNTTTTANAVRVGPTSGTAPFTVTIKAAQGGTIRFPNSGTTGSVTTQKGGVQTLAQNSLTTTPVVLAGGGALTFGSSGGQINAGMPGVITLPASASNLGSAGITMPAVGGSVTLPASTAVTAGALAATVAGTITAPDGSSRTFTAGKLPAIAGGSTISYAGGKLAQVSTTATAIAVTATNNLPASTPTTIAVGSVVRFATGGSVGTVTGTVTGLTITKNLQPGVATSVVLNDSIQLAGSADTATVTSNSAFNVSGNGPVTLALDSSNPTKSNVTFIAGTGSILAAVPAGTYSVSGAVGVSRPTAGALTLASVWDLSTYRYGPNVDPAKPGSGEPGILRVRTPGDVQLTYTGYNSFTRILAAGSLSDGFGPVVAPTTAAANGLWQAPLLPAGAQSWTYQLVAGADLGAADGLRVLPAGGSGATGGSVLIGRSSGALLLPTTPDTTGTSTTVSRTAIIPQFYQTIRTGTGNITLSAARDVQFLNPLATVFTAGQAAKALANFDVPVLNSTLDQSAAQTPYAPAQYSLGGGNVDLRAQGDIVRYRQTGTGLVADSSRELPTNWLYRRSNVDNAGLFAALTGSSTPTTEIQSTSWWVDFTNFFGDVGALGGGNVTLTAGHNISNVNAAVATNARMPGKDASGQPIAPDATTLLELGGGNLTVKAGTDIDGGVYYVERGAAKLQAGRAVTTNATRVAFLTGTNVDPLTWLPTTFFLGKGSVDVVAAADVTVGQVANPFLLPQGVNNRTYESTYFSTFGPTDSVTVTSLGGKVSLRGQAVDAGIFSNGSAAWLLDWYVSTGQTADKNSAAASQPWLRLALPQLGNSVLSALKLSQTVAGIMPGTLRATAIAGDIDLVGGFQLTPTPTGTVELVAGGNINGLVPNGITGDSREWRTASINLSDADPARVPGVTNPLSLPTYSKSTSPTLFSAVDALFAESGTTKLSLEQKLALHDQAHDDQGQPMPLHAADTEPLRLYAAGGDLSGLTLYAPKTAKIVADRDITDIALYVQNTRATDTSLVAAGHDLIAYDPASTLRLAAQEPGNILVSQAGATGPVTGTPTTGDIQIAGPGSLEVLAGRNLTLGSGSSATSDGTAVGIVSVGAVRNPVLPLDSGADIIAVGGTGTIYSPAAASLGLAPGLATTSLGFPAFIAKFLDPGSGGELALRYLPVLGAEMGLTTVDPAAIWTAFGFTPGQAPTERQAALVLDLFNRILRDSALDRRNPKSATFGKYSNGFAAIAALFPGSPEPTEADLQSKVPVARPASPWTGRISLPTRLIKTTEGGSITLLAPGGDITVGRSTDPQKPDQGVLTERGGGISVFAADSVNVGTSRIFTLRGGNELVWSTWGNVAAGSGSKTVFSAPPTRVLIDPQSGDVQNDLAGLATGSGIGVLATLAGVKPGDVDLIAPVGTIDAGDAGIRSSGNINLSAANVLNAGNIQAGGSTTGAPPPPAPPNIGAFSAAATASAGSSSAANDVARQEQPAAQAFELPSLISVEVIGYGGDDPEDKENAEVSPPPPAKLDHVS